MNNSTDKTEKPVVTKSRANDQRRWMYDTGAGVWTNEGTPEKINSGIALMKSAGITDVIVGTWLSGPTWHAPEIEPNHPTIQAYKWDAVGHYLEEAALNGMSCHAYFSFGSRIGPYKPEFVTPGTPTNAFDVFMPEYQKWLVANIQECLERYPQFTGVSLDYTRIGGKHVGGPWAQRFLDETGFDLETCYWLSQYGGYYSDAGLVRTAILNDKGIDVAQTLPGWNASNIYRAIELYYKWAKYPIERFLNRVRAVMPAHMELSAYGLTHFPEWNDGRDLNGWVNSGLIDTGLSVVADFTKEQLQATKFGRRTDPQAFKFDTVPSSNIALVLRTYSGGDSNATIKSGATLQAEIDNIRVVYPDLPALGYYFLRGASQTWLTPDLVAVMKDATL